MYLEIVILFFYSNYVPIEALSKFTSLLQSNGTKSKARPQAQQQQQQQAPQLVQSTPQQQAQSVPAEKNANTTNHNNFQNQNGNTQKAALTQQQNAQQSNPQPQQQQAQQHQAPQQQQLPAPPAVVAGLDPTKIVPIQITLPPQPGVPNSEPRVLTIQVPASALQENQLHQVLTGPIITSIMTLPPALASSVLQQHVNAVLQNQAIVASKFLIQFSHSHPSKVI